ncbi:MAG: histidine triad family protein [Clostridia bacterium]|jgi:histidine triad (HIT) family protein|nr:histidine triad family protein [Clostridia bacterium]MDN5321763.1 histidine triad family protein [Clostridia bacterium]
MLLVTIFGPGGERKMSDCIFCKIVDKEIPAKVVYEDDTVLAFNDIQPQAPVHVLVIPKKHISDLTALAEADLSKVTHIFKVIKEIAKDKGIDEEGYRIVNNCREKGGQTVGHLHFHLLGGRQMHWPPG